MGKSETGPDMRDCSEYARAIQDNLDCSVAVLLEPVTRLDTSSWRVGLVATSRELLVSGPAWSAAVTVHWPSRAYRDFGSALYGGLAQLDADVGRQTFQKELNLA